MAHHKRRKPPNSRAGCLLCRPWKATGYSKKFRLKFSEYRKYYDTEEQMKNLIRE